MNNKMSGGREAFVRKMLPSFVSAESILAADETVSDLLKLLSLAPPAKVLDIPSFGGSIAVAFAKRGFNVVAVDQFDEFLETGKGIAVNNAVKMEWINCSPFKFHRKEHFNLILNLNFDFGCVVQDDEISMQIANLYHSLATGGRLVLRTIGQDVLEKYFHPKFWTTEKDGSFLLNERELDHQNGWLNESYLYINGLERERYDYKMKLYYPYQLQEMLESNGFKKVSFWGDLKGNAYGNFSPYLLVVAEKCANNFIRC